MVTKARAKNRHCKAEHKDQQAYAAARRGQDTNIAELERKNVDLQKEYNRLTRNHLNV